MKPSEYSRRDFIRAIGIGAASFALGSAGICMAGKKTRRDGRPNLVFILADQLGYSRCGYGGDSKAITPNIDRLASEGANYFNAVSNMPVCAAYRASLFTGKYTTSTGMVINELRMRTDHECFGHVLTGGGYDTGYVGKWHLYANELGNHLDPKNSFVPRGPNRLGFDGYWAAYGFHHNYYNAYYHTESAEKIFYGEDVYEPDAQTDLAIDYISKASQSDKPFAAFLSLGTPHDPWNANNVPKEYADMFEDVSFPNPPNYKDENDEHADAWGSLRPEERKNLSNWRRYYYAMTANLDRNVGRLMKALDRMGLTENTIVVFSSDHGEMFGAQGRRAKNIFYEEAARIPFLVRWPKKIAAKRRCDSCLSTVDIMPTVLSLMGLSIPKEAEGMDLSLRATSGDGPEPEAAFLQNTGACAAWRDGHEWRALRDKRYTYAIYRVDKTELLFDNIADPYQMTNLAEDEKHKGTMERFRRILADKMRSLNDTFEKCTWYRDNWTDANRLIIKTARS